MNYWNVPIDAIPAQTGAENVMDCSDLADALNGLGLDPPLRDVMDVGCGTGRFSALCDGYRGADISPGAVQYATREGLDVWLISGGKDLEGVTSEWVTCFSVFTHIGRGDRQRYLGAFAQIAPKLIVDILPGVEGGSTPVWYADPDGFEDDVDAAGYEISAYYERTAPDGTAHRYYWCER